MTVLLFTRLPGGFLPNEDQGYFMVNYDAPVGATMQRTEAVVTDVEAYLRQQPQVRNTMTLVGYNAFGQGQGAAMSFVDLKPWDERTAAADSVETLIALRLLRYKEKADRRAGHRQGSGSTQPSASISFPVSRSS